MGSRISTESSIEVSRHTSQDLTDLFLAGYTVVQFLQNVLVFQCPLGDFCQAGLTDCFHWLLLFYFYLLNILPATTIIVKYLLLIAKDSF